MKPLEKSAKWIFAAAAGVSVAALVLICVFLFANGIPGMSKIGFLDFLTGKTWKPGNDIYGIMPMIFGSFYITAGAMLFGIPVGIFTAVFLAYYCPGKIYGLLKRAVDLLAGIPSVVYGFFGLVVLVPFIRNIGRSLGFGGSGSSILTASLLLGIMILPTIIGVAESSLRAVPAQYYEGALALGATRERSVFRVILPAAKSGVVTGVVLGIGRAVGETMAVIMVAGNQARMPNGLFKGVRTLTANIVIEMGYAAELHREALIATGVVLFVLILTLYVVVALLKRKEQA